MTQLAHDAAMLGIPIDYYQLFQTDDDDYLFWIAIVVDRVHLTYETIKRKANKGKK